MVMDKLTECVYGEKGNLTFGVNATEIVPFYWKLQEHFECETTKCYYSIHSSIQIYALEALFISRPQILTIDTSIYRKRKPSHVCFCSK